MELERSARAVCFNTGTTLLVASTFLTWLRVISDVSVSWTWGHRTDCITASEMGGGEEVAGGAVLGGAVAFKSNLFFFVLF